MYLPNRFRCQTSSRWRLYSFGGQRSPWGESNRTGKLDSQSMLKDRRPLELRGHPALSILTSETYCCIAAGDGGADRDRTGDPLLAKQVLSQLSYSPLAKLRAG
jgi:hypothetical protein